MTNKSRQSVREPQTKKLKALHSSSHARDPSASVLKTASAPDEVRRSDLSLHVTEPIILAGVAVLGRFSASYGERDLVAMVYNAMVASKD